MPIKMLIDGVWHGSIEDSDELRARRRGSAFGESVEPGGRHAPESGRYHLYVSYACPWAHRTVIYRALKGLEEAIGMSVVEPRWATPNGWTFGAQSDPATGPTRDHVNGLSFLYEVYRLAAPRFTGKVTVPILFDTKHQTIVSNESGDIIRMLDGAFDAHAKRPELEFYPAALRPAIDALNEVILERICMGVYKAGFASTQAAYDRAVGALFGALDEMEARLHDRPFLFGERITESDWHLFATLVRFDAVYHGALKCNLRRIDEYPNLRAYVRRLHDQPDVAATVKLDHVRRHYYDDLGLIDPTIVPAGPKIDFGDGVPVRPAA